MKSIKTLIVSATMVAATSSISAMWTFSDGIDGLQETPPNASPATGIASGTYDDVTNMLMIDISASGFVAPITAKHIHKAPVGVAGGVVFALSGPTGGTSLTSHDMFVLTEAMEADFLGGLYYVNIHSSAFPGGEIRGQLHATPVPEPGTLVAGVLGLAAFAVRRRKV